MSMLGAAMKSDCPSVVVRFPVDQFRRNASVSHYDWCRESAAVAPKHTEAFLSFVVSVKHKIVCASLHLRRLSVFGGERLLNIIYLVSRCNNKRYKDTLFCSITVTCTFLLSGATPAFAQSGYATYYTVKSSSTRTASNTPYLESAYTCALPHHDFGGWYQVCTTARCVRVQHTDYGPGERPRRRGVVIDLTPAAFRALAPLREGKIAVTVERLS